MKLSKYQEEILLDLNLGLYVWSDEGENYKVWLGNKRGEVFRYIRKDTAELLLNRGYIQYSEEMSRLVPRMDYFCYILDKEGRRYVNKLKQRIS